jgi:EAL domain-containing protein (putative c-di-GMP-specific phosphodiesterase class I)
MDPLGLALENFNALGMWRGQEFGQPIDPSGTLATGENFSDIKELKHILVKDHAEDFYRTLTQKLLTYALGRGLDYYDVETVDQIVARIEQSGGKPSALLAGIIESAPFQKARVSPQATAANSEHEKEKL